ncbi:unnamed protein product [Arctia plantaginis]|uniref:ODAD1 central coiled coil region domain-containing protein n=1 Tax=Arctia plantaginis TaxID=874455 RepID=A0A8S1BB75_ARCPL|nr:unnamed protein product [Arctia plantaginis]CAB3256843.1 unnamed protein product [Arctia plantaginis]
MPTQIDQKVVDPEAELSNAQRMFQKLAPMCSVAKRAAGIPQLAPQEKQMNILKHELKETQLCINLATKGQHAVHDSVVKKNTQKSILDYENLEAELRDEKAQESELDVLNYLAKKLICDLSKTVPTEADELAILEAANNRLRRMENRLDLATKRFCIVNASNRQIREEINRLLVERNDFNVQWNRTIGRLLRGKEYLMDIFEIATVAFAERDECCRKLEALKWRGLFQLNRDISEMQGFEGDLNQLAKLEEFLRTKGSRRLCEADEKEEIRRHEEVMRCEQEIAKYDKLLDDVFAYAGTHKMGIIMTNFDKTEIENFSLFILLCEVLQESMHMRRNLESMRQRILDARDRNEAQTERHERKIVEMTMELNEQQQRTRDKLNQNIAAENTFNKVLKGIDDLVKLIRYDITPLLVLLGNHREVTQWNVSRFLNILECEIKSLIEVVYGAVKPPPPMPKGRKSTTEAPPPATKLVADPHVEVIRPNKIDKLVPYKPCAYCVEDYIMNLVFETPAVLADKEYIESIFHLEDENTKFGIYTLTIPEKRHPLRGKKE